MCLAGRTPLVFAVHSENAAVVKYLLDHGADPDKADDIGLTPLHSAAGIGPVSIHIYLCFACVHHMFLYFCF
jgi:ankyrin repeat protein